MGKEFERMDAMKESGYLPLMKEKKFPDWLIEITTDKDPEEKLPEKRVRKQVSYKESDYWKGIEKHCVEDDDEEEESDKENEKRKKKKKNQRKRKRNEMNVDGNDESSDNRKRRKYKD